MAEGIQVSSVGPKYFCHHCSREVSPCRDDELICPECSSGFLEEVSKDLYEVENISQDGDDDYESEQDDEDPLSLMSGMGMENLIGQMLLNVAGIEETDALRRSDEQALQRADSLSEIIEHMNMSFQDRSSGASDLLRLRYFEDIGGDEELDALASQLLDEAEISGPPPLQKEQIKSLPIVTIAPGDIEKGLQCTVCMDDFSLREKAKRLPCHHLYHEKCITPWLERQATCPNCRNKVDVPLQSKRSRSCPRYSSRLNHRTADSRRLSEVPSLGNFLPMSRNPFRFLN